MIYILFIISILFLLLFLLSKKKNNFIDYKKIHFLHIPKNAGSTFKTMYPYFKKKKLSPHYEATPKNNKINIVIIRNPYTRLISIFSHIKYRTNINTSNDLINFETLDDLCKAYFDSNHKYHQKAKYLFTWNDGDIIKYKKKNYFTKEYYGCDKTLQRCIHWCPQSLFVKDKNKIQYFIKFENLNNDLINLQNIGILEKVKISHSKKSPDTIKNKNNDITPTIDKLVKYIYKDDIILWNSI